MKKSEHKGLSIFHRLLIVFLLLIIGISGILTGVFYFFSKQSYTKYIEENLRQQFAAIDTHFESKVKEPLIKDLELLSSNPSLDEFMMSDSIERRVTARSVEKLFLETINYMASYQGIYFIDSMGSEKIKVNRKGRIKEYSNIQDSDLFARIESGNAKSVVIGELQADQNDRKSFSAGIHKTDPDIGEFGGAVIIEYSLDEFYGYLDSIEIFGEKHIWVFSPDEEILKQPQKNKDVLDPRPFLSREFQQNTVLSVFDNGMLIYKDLSVLPDRSLIRLAISVPKTLLLRDIHSTLKLLYFIFGISVVMISLLAFYFSKNLSRPIVELAKATTRLAKGDLSTRLRIQADGEVGTLVEKFNLMAETLERTTVSKDYVDNIIKSMIDTLIVVSPDNTIVRTNAAAYQLLGYKDKELIGQPFSIIIGEESPLEGTGKDNAFLDVSEGSIEKTYTAKDGKKIPVLFSASVMRDSNGKTEGIVCVAQDITERKRAEEELTLFTEKLKQSNRELQDFAHVASHDLQEPLRKVTGFGSRLKDKYADIIDESGRDYIDRMMNAATRMQVLINGLLDYSRITTRAKPFAPVDLSVVVHEVLADLEMRIEQTGAKVELTDLPTVDADPLQMRQLFQNLIGNALKFHKEGEFPVLKVSNEYRGPRHKDGIPSYNGTCWITVEDNGIGFDEKYTDRIFGVFQRLHGRDEYEGTGIGLSVCKKIVERHGGSINAKGELGKGTKFIITLPVKQAAEDGA